MNLGKALSGMAADLTAVPKKLVKKAKKLGAKKMILMVLPYVAFGYFGDKISYVCRMADGHDMSSKMTNIMAGLGTMFQNLMPSFHPKDLMWGVITGVVMRIIVYYKAKNAKKYRHGKEYGSAVWGGEKDIAPYMDADNFQNNILLTQTERLQLTGRPSGPKYARNKNILIIGGSGSGKTRFFIKPNLMQMHSSYVVTDPKGTVLIECGKMLRDGGYRIKVLNTINFDRSMHYNPFSYIRSEKDILKVVNAIILNTKGEGNQSGEDFWVKAERLLYTAYIGFMFEFMPPEDRTFATLIWMIDNSETREDDENYKNIMDDQFDKIAELNPESFSLRQYKKYKLAAGKTAKSILISCGARLAPFDIKELRDLTSTDDLELEKLGEEKTALFVIISDTDSTFNFIVSIMYTQLFNLLCDKADNEHNGSLPVHVRCLLDEFANIGQIPQFEKLIATIRSREISACVVLQAKSQLKAIYKDNADTIEGNCDTMLFLGGSEKTTLKEISEMLGKETIDLYNTSDTRGNSPSYGTNYQKTGKELMSQDELAVMDGGKCIMRIRGVRPFFSDKFDITQHEQYVKLSDYDKKNTFDVESYVKNPAHFKVTKSTAINMAVDLGTI